MTDPILDEMPFWYDEDADVEPWPAPKESEIILPCDDTDYDEEDLMLKWLPPEDKKSGGSEDDFDEEMFNYGQ